MAFVPYVPPTRQKPVSPQAQELANRIRTLIEEYRGYYPGLSSRDVRDALRVAGAGGSEPSATQRGIVVAIAGVVAALVGVSVATGTPGGEQPVPIMPLVVGIGIAAVAIAFFVRNR